MAAEKVIRLTNKQSFLLCKYMEGQPHIEDLSVDEIAPIARIELGFPITPSNVKSAAKTLGLNLRKKRVAQATEVDMLRAEVRDLKIKYEDLEDRLAQLEGMDAQKEMSLQ